MDDNNELIIYVLQQLRYGVPEQTIRATLAQNGWPQPLIDRAFSMVGQAQPSTPATDITGGQQAYGMPAANLPTSTADNGTSLPLPDEPQFKMPRAYDKPNGKQSWRKLLIILLTSLVLLGIGIGGYFAYKTLAGNKPKQQATAQPNATELDATRKQRIDQLAIKLQNYYITNKTYPLIAQINNAGFANTKNGFAIMDLVDPQWNKKLGCTDQQGNPVLIDARSPGCFSYRVTAMNGSDCNADSIACVRVVLTANLSDNKPYIVALNRNVKE
ncbi:MAG TPA: hypothetical protein VIR03_04090 [Candidatus Saccharimonadales bacterium]